MEKKIKITENDINYVIKKSLNNILKESVSGEDGHPMIYVGTYGKYNNGSLQGKWVDLTDFSDSDEFYDYCKQLHSDEPDAEFMFQDWEYIPDVFINESYISPDFWEFYNDDRCDYLSYESRCELMKHFTDYDEYSNNIEDIHLYPDCDDMTDVAMYSVENFGMPQDWYNYFDFDGFGRDVAIEYYNEDNDEETAYEAYGVDDGDDEALGEAIIDESYGDISSIDLSQDKWMKEMSERYFDYRQFGTAIDTEGTFISVDEGIVELP